jgi:hypothetical protein
VDEFTALAPGFVAIVGTTEEPTPVEVRVSSHVAASDDTSDEPIAQLAPGDTLTVELAAGDVLQLASAGPEGPCPGKITEVSRTRSDGNMEVRRYCDVGPAYDLTGTEIESASPVSVIAGHDCAFVPHNRPACDHLEETMFPLEAWGTEVVVTRAIREASEKYFVKVLSAVDGNEITVDPPLDVDERVVLDRGESFQWETSDHLLVTGEGPIQVAQFLRGQGDDDGPGDPSMSLAVPREQFKRSYVLLSPETFPTAYVNIVVATGSGVTLDGVDVLSFTEIGDTGLSVARQRLSRAGIHRVEGNGPTGIVTYGLADFTSYMVPGGLDIRLIRSAF